MSLMAELECMIILVDCRQILRLEKSDGIERITIGTDPALLGYNVD